MGKFVRTLVPLLLALALVVGTAFTSQGATRKLALGVSMLDDRNITAERNFTASVGGHAPAIWSVWSDWGGNSTDRNFPTSLMNHLHTDGVTPMVFWQPTNPANDVDVSYSYDAIIGGAHDAYIRSWARAAKSWGHTVILRFAHEMNGAWFPWGACRFNNSTSKFRRMWQHVWNIFKGPGGVGATNVKFLWNPYAPGTAECGTYAHLYPGDKYVDYAGFSNFNWVKKGTNWRPMVRVFSGAVTALGKVTSKPIIVGETGSSSVGGTKASWIHDGYPAVYLAYPQIKAIVYFNLDMTAHGQPNWLLTSPTSALAAYAKIVAKPKFQGKIH